MAEKVLVICPTRQAHPHAACWRDGQMAHGVHARTARRAGWVTRDDQKAVACPASGDVCAGAGRGGESVNS
jgi:hypothetical protein